VPKRSLKVSPSISRRLDLILMRVLSRECTGGNGLSGAQTCHRGEQGATLDVTAKRYDLDYGLLVALLIDDGLLVLRIDKGSGSTAEVVRVKR
jgi:hypothetical protein